MRTWALLLGVAAIVVAAVVDAIRSDSTEAASKVSESPSARDEPDALFRVADAPPAGSLPGKLVVLTGDGCRVRVVDFAGPTIGPEGPRTGCGLWLSPDGAQAAVSLPREPGTPGPFARIALVQLGDPPELGRELGLGTGEVAWSPDGTQVALCGTRGRTVLYVAAGGTPRDVVGCGPRFTPGGSLLTSPTQAFGHRLFRDGDIELDDHDLVQGFNGSPFGELDVLGYDEAEDGVLAVSAVRQEPLGTKAVLELWQDGRMAASVKLPDRVGTSSRRLGEYLRFSPNGDVLAIGFSAARDSMIYVDLRLRRSSLELSDQRGFAWSPDSQWLAVATKDEVVIYGVNSSEVVYRLPLAVAALGWVPEGND